jgi:hypothetical protein
LQKKQDELAQEILDIDAMEIESQVLVYRQQEV